MELILNNHKSDNNSEQYKDSNSSKTESQSVSISARTQMIQNPTSHFDIKNCTPRAINN